MSTRKNWVATSPVVLNDVEFWDSRLGSEDLRKEVIEWLNGGKLDGLAHSSTYTELLKEKYASKYPYTLPSSVSSRVIPYQLTYGSRTDDDVTTLTQETVTNLSLAQQTSISTAGIRTVQTNIAGIKIQDTNKYAQGFILSIAIDVRKYITEKYAEFLSASATWATVLSFLTKHDAQTILGLGGFYMESQDATNPLNDDESGVTVSVYVDNSYMVTTAGKSATKTALVTSTKKNPATNLTFDPVALAKACTVDGLLLLEISNATLENVDLNIGIRKDFPARITLLSASAVQIAVSIEYSFYNTFVLRSEFMDYSMGKSLAYTKASYIGKDMTYYPVSRKTTFNSSPVRLVMASTQYYDKASETRLTAGQLEAMTSTELRAFLSSINFQDILNTPLATPEGTSYFPPQYGRVPPDLEHWYHYCFNAGYGYVPTHYAFGMNSSNIVFGGYQFDWIRFFTTSYPAIFPTNSTLTEKVALLRNIIKPTLKVSYKNVKTGRSLYTRTSTTQGSMTPETRDLLMVSNAQGKLTGVGSFLTNTVDLDDSHYTFPSGMSHVIPVISEDTLNMDSTFQASACITDKGTTEVVMASPTIGTGDVYSRAIKGEYFSPITFTVSFTWGLKEMISVIQS